MEKPKRELAEDLEADADALPDLRFTREGDLEGEEPDADAGEGE